MIEWQRIYGVAAILTLSALCALAGCGGASGGPSDTRGTSSATGLRAFGREAKGETRAEIADMLEGYLAALAADDGRTACGHLYRPVAQELPRSGAGCSSAVRALFSSQPRSARVALEETEVEQVLVKGNEAFAIVGHGGASEGFYPLQRVKGGWKVAALGISSLPEG